MENITKDQVKIIWSDHKTTRMHTFIVNAVINEEVACNLQKELSYHPAGYGFYGFKIENGISTWKCADCCD